MEIDPFTLVAQVVNFAILAFFLDKFLFKRVAAAMDERELRLRQRSEAAELELVKAKGLAEANEALQARLEAESEGILGSARTEAEEARRAAMDRLRAEADSEREAWRDELAGKRSEFLGEMRLRAASCIGSIATKAISDLADESLEQRMAWIFAERLRRIDGQRASEIRDALDSGEAAAIVRSSFPLSAPAREEIAAALLEGIGYSGPLGFEARPEAEVGLSIDLDGFRVSWDLRRYERAFEDRLFDALKAGGTMSGKAGGHGE
jgi:F-type H+-transporting ATPase subunit b